MKQALVKKGIVVAMDIPEPTTKQGFIKIKVLYSCVSAGTEMTGVVGSRKSLLKRAFEDPKKLKLAVDYIKNKGLKSTKNKLVAVSDSMNTIGYSLSGVVSDIGEGVTGYNVGDFVSAGGSGFALHADYVNVPKNLVVKVPKGLHMSYASTGTVGSIAMQGVRRADLKLGEYVVVFGTGLLGLLSLQMLKAAGNRVACIDLNQDRLDLAKTLGAEIVINPTVEDPVMAINNWTQGYGSDAVIFTASTSKDEPLSQSFKMCRKKGKVILVGVSGMKINRGDIYANEIDFKISASYGPGRYDDTYELEGHDYPYAYVRWTENRNISEYLRLVNEGAINLESLTPKIYQLLDVESAYKDLEDNPSTNILTLLKYEDYIEHKEPIKKIILNNNNNNKKITIGIIGAGSFAASTLIPIINQLPEKFSLKTIVNRNGHKAMKLAKEFNASIASTSAEDIFNDPDIDLVVICTRHDSHAELVLKCLKTNKHVFVEKPLATSHEQLNSIMDFYNKDNNKAKPITMVGFNRRFSPYSSEIKKAVIHRSTPLFMHYRMNAGYIPVESWVHKDGGRIVGEGCHIIDLMTYLTGSRITEVSVNNMNSNSTKYISSDNKSITFKFEDGSIGVLDYFSTGSKLLSKEYMEVHFDNKSIIMDDYKSLKGYGIKLKKLETNVSKKGHFEEWLKIHETLTKGVWEIPLEDLYDTTRISIIASHS